VIELLLVLTACFLFVYWCVCRVIDDWYSDAEEFPITSGKKGDGAVKNAQTGKNKDNADFYKDALGQVPALQERDRREITSSRHIPHSRRDQHNPQGRPQGVTGLSTNLLGLSSSTTQAGVVTLIGESDAGTAPTVPASMPVVPGRTEFLTMTDPSALSDGARLREAAARFHAAARWLEHAADGDTPRNEAIARADGLIRAAWSFLDGPEAA
jgi:hypothetical protein